MRGSRPRPVHLRVRGRGRGGPGRHLRLAGMCVVLAAILTFTVHEALEPGAWQRVFATREGLVGRRLPCGEIIQSGAMFVALPHRSALHRSVELRYRDRVAVVPVLDVGPWNTDDAYWSAGERPAAEQGRGTF